LKGEKEQLFGEVLNGLDCIVRLLGAAGQPGILSDRGAGLRSDGGDQAPGLERRLPGLADQDPDEKLVMLPGA